jgi:hypothetical protein
VPAETIREAIDRAGDAYAALGEIGETIEDEWSYVTDLSEAWQARLDEVVSVRGAETLTPEGTAAIDRVIVEIGTIVDPHRAIDWLSTFPQVVLLALEEEP